jgi:hypothetical protein
MELENSKLTNPNFQNYSIGNVPESRISNFESRISQFVISLNFTTAGKNIFGKSACFLHFIIQPDSQFAVFRKKILPSNPVNRILAKSAIGQKSGGLFNYSFLPGPGIFTSETKNIHLKINFMKNSTFLRLVIFIGFLQISYAVVGQQINPWSVRRAYMNFNAPINGGGTFQFNMHFNNKWVGFMGYEIGSPTSKNMPSDYQHGYSMLLGVEFKDSNPDDSYSLVTLGMGKVLTKSSDKAWVIATAGISFGSYQEQHFTPTPSESFNWILIGGRNANYQTKAESKTMVGITPGIEGHVNLFRFMALSSGAKAMISNTGFFPTFNLGMDIGLMRPARKNMIKNLNKQ